jgi:hypothetical protein
MVAACTFTLILSDLDVKDGGSLKVPKQQSGASVIGS